MKHYNAEEKNKIVELILNKEKTIKELASESEDSPSVGTIARWKKEYLSQGPYVMIIIMMRFPHGVDTVIKGKWQFYVYWKK